LAVKTVQKFYKNSEIKTVTGEIMKTVFAILTLMALVGCSSANESRQPASRAGRAYQEPKVMNNQNVDTESLYQACVKEWPELYCRNRMGR
jgi:hypothetical protein